MPNLKDDYDVHNGISKYDHIVFRKRGGIVVTQECDAPGLLPQFWVQSEAVEETWQNMKEYCLGNSLPFFDYGNSGDWLFFLADMCPNVHID